MFDPFCIIVSMHKITLGSFSLTSLKCYELLSDILYFLWFYLFLLLFLFQLFGYFLGNTFRSTNCIPFISLFLSSPSVFLGNFSDYVSCPHLKFKLCCFCISLTQMQTLLSCSLKSSLLSSFYFSPSHFVTSFFIPE